MGTHKGFWFHTIGQRRGSGLSGGPWYVVSKDIQNNIVYLSRNYYSKDKSRDEFEVSNVNWINGACPEKDELFVKLRHGKNKYKASVAFTSDKKVFIKLHERDQGIAPGQFAVFYDGDVCLGGGVITKSL